MSNIFLCFFGDSSLWDNVVLTTAYPTDFSYHRPFRYRDAWIQLALLDEMKSDEKRYSFVGKTAILGMRFLSEQYKSVILPIRQIEITQIDYMPDNHSIYFKMRKMIDFSLIKDLRSICFELPDEERTDNNMSALFISSNAVMPNNLSFLTNGREEAAWVAYSDHIALDRTVPINDEARNSLFFCFCKPYQANACKTEEIYHSRRMGKLFGARLVEGENYELSILHRTPILIVTHTTFGRVNVKYESPSGNIELSQSEEDFTGNYQTHIIPFTAKKQSGTWEEIIVKPIAEKVIINDERTINTLSLKIPVKIHYSFLYHFKSFYIFVVLLWFVLILTELLEGIAENKLSLPWIIIYSISSALAAILIVVVSQRGKS